MFRLLWAVVLALALPALAEAVTLTWQDNSDNEAGFYIERAPTSTGVFTQIGQVGAGVTTFGDTLGVGGNCYRVRAYNSWGNSVYSNVACVGFPPTSPGNLTIAP